MIALHLLLAAVLLLLVCVGVGRGEFPMSVPEVLEVLGGGGSRSQRFIVIDVRLPRALVGLLVGAALGMAGALTQSMLRNPLAAPDVLGVTAGAGLGAVALMTFGGAGFAGGVAQTIGAPAAALLGGFGTALAIYLLAWRRGVDGLRLVLIGIGINAMLLAAINWLLIHASIQDVGHAMQWLNGSLQFAGWSQFWPLLAGFAAAAAIAGWSVPAMAVLRLGDDKARSLGVRLQARQAVVFAAAVALACFATAAAGPITFVALAAPQIARRLYRTAGEPIVGAALVGALLVAGGDIAARTVLPVTLPVGVVTSGLGGLFLLHLLIRLGRRRR